MARFCRAPVLFVFNIVPPAIYAEGVAMFQASHLLPQEDCHENRKENREAARPFERRCVRACAACSSEAAPRARKRNAVR